MGVVVMVASRLHRTGRSSRERRAAQRARRHGRASKGPKIMSKPRAYRYRVVDVFTTQAFEGNALAVFPDSSGIDDATMQRIAQELNLSETTFVAPATRADCVAHVRIFTPAREMVFAG